MSHTLFESKISAGGLKRGYILMQFGKNEIIVLGFFSVSLGGDRCINPIFLPSFFWETGGGASPNPPPTPKTVAGATLIHVKLINPFSVAPGFSIPRRLQEMVAVLFSN